MPVKPITKRTRWECQKCGKCCEDLIVSKNKALSKIVDGKVICKYYNPNTKLCKKYDDKRPFMCQIYPFVINIDSIFCEDKIARPYLAFELENLKIHTECLGYGKGKRIYANKNLQKKLERLSKRFSENFKKAFEKKIDVREIM